MCDTHGFTFPMHERAKCCTKTMPLLRLRLEFLVNYIRPLESRQLVNKLARTLSKTLVNFIRPPESRQ